VKIIKYFSRSSHGAKLDTFKRMSIPDLSKRYILIHLEPYQKLEEKIAPKITHCKCQRFPFHC